MPYTVISHKTAPTSDAFDFASIDLTGYADVQLILNGLVVGTDDADILITVDIGGTEIAAAYRIAGYTTSSSAATETATSTSQANISLNDQTTGWGVGNAAGESFAGIACIRNAMISVAKILQAHTTRVFPSGNSGSEPTAGQLNNTGTLDGLNVTVSTGTLMSGTATLVGIATA